MGEGVWTMTDTEFNRELAKAWGEGYGAGWNDCLLDLQNGGAKTSRNPYQPTA